MQKNKIKIIFFGTSDFAVPVLEALVKDSYSVAAVITTPDEPAGKKRVITPPPMKLAAQRLNIPVLQPDKLRGNSEFLENIKKIKPYIGIAGAYGKIIPQDIINLPEHGILVIHPSLLPKYRGPSPVQAAILNGDEKTGVTIIKIDDQIDHGDIVSVTDYQIPDNGSFKEINDEIWRLGANLLIKTLPDYLTGEIQVQEQDHSQATFCKLLKSEDGEITSDDTAEKAYNKIRALNPEPGTYLWLNKNDKKTRLKILNAESKKEPADFITFPDLFIINNQPALQLKDGHLILKKIQLEGGKPLNGEDFARGHRDLFMKAR